MHTRTQTATVAAAESCTLTCVGNVADPIESQKKININRSRGTKQNQNVLMSTWGGNVGKDFPSVLGEP